MKPTNFTARRNKIWMFAGLYAASIALLVLIFSALGGRISVSDPQPEKMPVILQTNFTDMALLHADSLLHSNLRELQQLDNQYAVLRTDSNAATNTSNNVAMIIGYTEQAFGKTLDSIETAMPGNLDDERKSRYTTMLASFRAVLHERMAMKSIQAAIGNNKKTPGSLQPDALMWKDELSRKDYEIARLEAVIKNLQDNPSVGRARGADQEAQKGETELLKTAFSDQQKEYDALKENLKHIKTENQSLTAQLVELKKAAASQSENASNAADTKMRSLEQKMDALNADLYFAKIDCNLARTDAQQMISNARQRKELLSESLLMLNGLAKSEDADVQKKAKEKIARLNRIANTLHD